MDESIAARAVLRQLVAFDTTSRNANLDLIDFVRDDLARHGIGCTLIPNAEGTKANLLASIGPAVPGGIVLSGHTDVVPIDGQAWDTDPFALTETPDGRLFGRGTADMKSFLAVALAMVPRFAAASLAVPIHLAFSYDEEVGCFGAYPLVERLRQDLPRPRIVIVGEPTMMRVVNAQNTGNVLVTRFRGVEAHSSMTHLGVSAVQFAGEFVHWLNRRQDAFAAAPRTDLDLVPPHATINVGMIAGGTACNILARDCIVHWHYRTTPGEDRTALEREARLWLDETLLPAMRRRHPDAEIETTLIAGVDGLVPGENQDATQLALSWSGSNRAHAVPYGTEAGIFRAAGIETIICGPGDIAQAHQPNEFIDATQLQACVAFMTRLLDWASHR
jgi:acetylornithine deacetylase